jgi:hypothetical protein
MTATDKKERQKQIEKMETLYALGDYKLAKSSADALAKENLDEKSRRRVEKVRAGTRIDPVAIGAMVFTFLVLAYLVVKYAW